jgi:hypothetical protein
MSGRTTRGIFGSPIAYVALMAAVVAVFQLIPFSVVLGPGISFPLSLAIIGLVGILLGPWAGAVAVAIGSGIGVLIAPHTAFLGPLTIVAMVLTPIGTGLITNGKRVIVGFFLIAVAAIWWALFLATNGWPEVTTALLQPWRYLLPGILLLLPGLTDKAVRLLKSENRLALGAALGYIIWIGGSIDHSFSAIVGNLILFQLPEDVWSFLILFVIGAERGALALVGLIVGIGVIFGLRQMGARKPTMGIW